MLPAPIPENEAERLRTLCSLQLLDSPSSPELDRITRTASRLFQVPIALITLVDADRQWFKSSVGMDVSQTPRDISFCGHAMLLQDALVVHDTTSDLRFRDNPLVIGPPHIRFYAGHPVRSRQGLALGTLCLIDTRPRTFDENDRKALADLAAMVQQHVHALEADSAAHSARASLARNELLLSRTLRHAAVGIAIASPEGVWIDLNQRFCEIIGQPRAWIEQRPLDSLLHPQDRRESGPLIDAVLRHGSEAVNREWRFLRADGSVSWTKAGISALPDEDGGRNHMIIVLTDINAEQHTRQALERLQRELEDRIQMRTGQLHTALQQTRAETAAREKAQAALREEMEHFQGVLDNASDAFIEIDRGDRIVYWNRAADRIFGWTAQEATGRTLAETIIPGPLHDRYQRMRERIAGKNDHATQNRRIEINGMRRSGEVFPLELTVSTGQVDGEPRIHLFMHDISHRKANEQIIRENAARLKAITNNLPALIAFIGRDLRYRFHNEAYREWFDIPVEGLVGTDARAFWGAQTYRHLQPALEQVLQGHEVSTEYRLTAREGPMWFYTSLVPHVQADGSVDGFYLIAQDITERKKLYDKIEHEARHDILTGLPNRRALIERLEEAMARARRQGRAIAVLFLDLDGFKNMNDTLGHEFGDAVLQQFAGMILASVRETDYVARLAGDEFVCVLEGLDEAHDQAATVAGAILERVRGETEVMDVAVRLSSSIGVAIHTGKDEETPQELLTRADAAMYRAKHGGKGRSAF